MYKTEILNRETDSPATYQSNLIRELLAHCDIQQGNSILSIVDTKVPKNLYMYRWLVILKFTI